MAFAGNTCNIKNISEIIRACDIDRRRTARAGSKRSADIGRSDGAAGICPSCRRAEPHGLNAEQRSGDRNRLVRNSCCKDERRSIRFIGCIEPARFAVPPFAKIGRKQIQHYLYAKR